MEFDGDIDGEMLNYSEMDSVIDSTAEGSLFPLHDVSSSSCSSSSSSSNNSKRKRKPVDPLKKKPRIDYKNPFHADRLLVAINSVISSLEGEPEAFHKNIMMIAKSHNIPYNTLRDNFLRARGIEPRAHRNSERKRQADALAAAAEKGVVSVAKPSTLLVQTHPVSVHVAGALNRDQINPVPPNKIGPAPPRGLALAYALAGPLGEAHAPPIGPRATSYQIPVIQIYVPPVIIQAPPIALASVGVDADSDDSGDDEF